MTCGPLHTVRAETMLKAVEVQAGTDIDVDDGIVWRCEKSH